MDNGFLEFAIKLTIDNTIKEALTETSEGLFKAMRALLESSSTIEEAKMRLEAAHSEFNKNSEV